MLENADKGADIRAEMRGEGGGKCFSFFVVDHGKK